MDSFSPSPPSATRRVTASRNKRKAGGLKRREVWANDVDWPAVKAFVKKLNATDPMTPYESKLLICVRDVAVAFRDNDPAMMFNSFLDWRELDEARLNQSGPLSEVRGVIYALRETANVMERRWQLATQHLRKPQQQPKPAAPTQQPMYPPMPVHRSEGLIEMDFTVEELVSLPAPSPVPSIQDLQHPAPTAPQTIQQHQAPSVCEPVPSPIEGPVVSPSNGLSMDEDDPDLYKGLQFPPGVPPVPKIPCRRLDQDVEEHKADIAAFAAWFREYGQFVPENMRGLHEWLKD